MSKREELFEGHRQRSAELRSRVLELTGHGPGSDVWQLLRDLEESGFQLALAVEEDAVERVHAHLLEADKLRAWAL